MIVAEIYDTKPAFNPPKYYLQQAFGGEMALPFMARSN
jgi:hypothetical protein